MLSREERQARSAAQRIVREIGRREREAAKASRPPKMRPFALGQRDPRERNSAYLSAVRQAPCLFCLVAGRTQTVRTEAAHVKTGYPEMGRGWRHFGVQEKSHDWRALPSCSECHRTGERAQHNSAEARWYSDHNVHPPTVCARLYAAYEAGVPLSTIVGEIVHDIHRGVL